MEKIADSVLRLIGNTPMVELIRLGREAGAEARIVAKVESFNPAGSVKDRIALAMVEQAEARGTLRPGGTIIEPTSGNTGVGLALVSALKGYRLILTMPETMSIERRRLVAAYGARVVLTPGDEGMKGAIARAEALRREIPGAVILGQFSNPANPERHYRTTGDEIWRDTDGRVDLLVAGVGTGGTLCGTGRRLRELNPQIGLVAVEPASSPVLSGGKPGAHKIQGIGAGFIPENFDLRCRTGRPGDDRHRRAGHRHGASAGRTRRAAGRHFVGGCGLRRPATGPEAPQPRQNDRRRAGGHRRALPFDTALRIRHL